jgi:hypothetical protein
MDEAAARIAGQLFAERQQALLVPFDHLGPRIGYDQRSHRAANPRRANPISATVNSLDIRNSSPGLISWTSMSEDGRRRRKERIHQPRPPESGCCAFGGR